ncbi:MAG: hypothetical protein VW378_02245 [bacterium]
MSAFVTSYLKEVLDTWIAKNHLRNGLLFYGSTSGFPNKVANYFIQAYFSSSTFSLDTNPDFLHIYSEKQIKIDHIRHILDRVRYGPTQHESMIVFIEHLERLTIEASNALLKTLETPPKHVYFLSSSHLFSSLLPTITSRCQPIYCPSLTYDQLFSAVNMTVSEISSTSTYEDLLKLACGVDHPSYCSFHDFLHFSLSKRFAFFHQYIDTKETFTTLLYHWLSELSTDQTYRYLSLSKLLRETLTRLTHHVNLKLQFDSFISQLPIT